MSNLIISPKTKVGELLDAYPQLEEVLISLSPAFSKLKNPVLRKTVARVATLQQAAMVGGLKTEELINRLRIEAGQEALTDIADDTGNIPEVVPDWFDKAKIKIRFDATPIINTGGSPMGEIMSLTGQLKTGEIMELTTPFLPAPIIDLLKTKGYQVFTTKEEQFLTCIFKAG